MAEGPGLEDLPEALPTSPHGRLPQLVWLIPIVAALIGGWIAVRAILQQGPTVTISFRTAEGLEPGKTKVRYKDVDIGQVETIVIAKDRSHIIVTAEFSKEAEPFLVEDTRFWVVRPRIAGGQISGVTTLLSGAYIAMDVGKSDKPRREFVGLEVPPIVTGDLPGRQFMLEAKDLGSLDIGSPVYFRRIKVGEVIAYELDPNGQDVHILIFVHAPYDQFVHTSSKFWNASGVDVSLDAAGMHVETQSLVTILAGGIAFETPEGQPKGQEAPPGSAFTLFQDRATALKAPDGEPQPFVMYFEDSLRGLSPGAPVDFHGINVGEVQSVDIEYDRRRRRFRFPVRAVLYPKRLGIVGEDQTRELSEAERQELFRRMIDQGLRAQLRVGNLLTGQRYIALDFFPEAPPARVDWDKAPLQLPTTPATMEELQQALAKLLRKIDKIPFAEIGADTRSVLASLNATARSLDGLLKQMGSESAPEFRAALAELRRLLAELEQALAADSPLRQELTDALKESARAARSVRSLANTLERQPEALLRGKTRDRP
ncbi:intermembrane transport protein PqiB [Candidatus Methylocalor cossyra]|uniref:Paraquat-inducible protein B n=1 Tax=Candidatus Methylocalor cossyra TaxID=3108543 RepID=A0ABM9NK98_9GAMM